MQVVAISIPRNNNESELIHAHHKLRADVFSGRLRWEVDVRDGIEVDRFDALHPTYILSVKQDGKVAGCTRLIPALGPTMVQNVFPSLLPNRKLNAHSAMIESSRFCVDTRLKEGRGFGFVRQTTLTMFAGVIEWSIAHGFNEIITVTDLRLERILAHVGWPLQRLSAPQKIGVTAAVAGILPADAQTLSRLRPTGYSSLLTTPLINPPRRSS